MSTRSTQLINIDKKKVWQLMSQPSVAAKQLCQLDKDTSLNLAESKTTAARDYITYVISWADAHRSWFPFKDLIVNAFGSCTSTHKRPIFILCNN